MLHPVDVLNRFPARKTKVQKQAFRDAVQGYAEKLGYQVFTEQNDNLVIGDPQNAKFLLSCGSAPSGVAVWLETLRTFPENQRHKVCFLLFDGKTGASAYRRNHKETTDKQLLLDLGHLGDGNHIRMFPTNLLKQDRKRLTSLYAACGYFGSRDLLVEEGKKPLRIKIPGGFPYAVTIHALQDHKKKMRYPIKTKDTAMDITNVNILRAALTTFICCDEVN